MIAVMPTETFEILRYALRHGDGMPPFEWTVEFGDDAAIAQAWRAEPLHLATAEDVLTLLRGRRGGLWIAAGVAHDAARRARLPWVQAMAETILEFARSGAGGAMPAAPSDLRNYPYPIRAILTARHYVTTASPKYEPNSHDLVNVVPSGQAPSLRIGAWLRKHAPPPTWAEIRAHSERRRSRR